MKTFYQHIMKPIFLGTVILTLSIALATIFFMNKMITPDIEKLASSILTLKIEEVDNWLARHIETTEEIADYLTNTSFNEKNKNEIITSLELQKNKHNDEFESMGFITTDGEKYLTNGSHFDVKNRAYFQKLSQSFDRTHLSMIINSQANQAQVVLIVSKVYNEKNAVIGYVSTALPIDYIRKSVTSSDQLYSTYIYHAQTGEPLLGEPSDQKKFLKIDKAIPSHSNWRIRLTIARKNILLSLDKTVIFILLLTLILTLTSMFLMKKRLASVTRPIKELENSIGLSAEGKYINIKPDKHILEINHFGETYNEMVDNISTQQDVIRTQAQEKNKAEQKALYAQIKPHFLYNTLQTIQAMAFDLDSIMIEEAIGELAIFYRIGLSSDAQIITIDKECEHISSYLKILLLRYENLFTYEINNHVDPKQEFLKFTIQPLVENAIYHGIKPTGKKGHLIINIYEKNTQLIVDVLNKANHVTDDDITQINKSLSHKNPNGSYGLFNVNQRLLLHFGSNYGVHVSLRDNYFVASIQQPMTQERNSL